MGATDDQLPPRRDDQTVSLPRVGDGADAAGHTHPAPSAGSRNASRTPNARLQPGQELAGRYRIVGELGTGGMGTVCEAVDTLLDRRVAVKFLRHIDGDEARATVIREARAMAALRHRSICRVLEVVIDPPTGTDRAAWQPFIVMEWIAGTTLVSASKGLPFEKRLTLFESVVEGVAAMHAAGLVHRDLKPGNILLDQDGVPVLVDFGLSARTGGDEPRGGTPGWSAPEQFNGLNEVKPPADIFALGVLFYQMLTGVAPFEGASTQDVLRKVREGDAPLPESLVPGIAAPLQRIALAAIDPDPAQRYTDAAAMLADLRRFKAGETVLARPRRLFTRFADEIERHLADTDRWQQQGLASEQECRPIRNGLRLLQRPESAWILDSRRLTRSQVALYLGGWLLLLALTIGIWNTTSEWREKGAALPWLVPTALAFAVTAAGLVLVRLGEQRAALGFLFTSALAVPVALWQLLRTEKLLVAAEGAQELLPMPELGFSNNQQLVVAGVALAVAVAYRRRTPSTAFTLLSAVFALWFVFAIGLRTFTVDGADRFVMGQIWRWLVLPSALLAMAGVLLDARSNRPSTDLLAETGPRDGGPTLIVGLAALVLSLSMLCTEAPEWFWFQSLATGENGQVLRRPTLTMRSSAFLGTGVLLLALSFTLGRKPTPLRDWCSRTLRWLVPSYLLLPIIFLEADSAAPGWGFWMTALGLVSLALLAASAALQWRPFLISGLLGMLDLFVRAFMRIEQHYEAIPVPENTPPASPSMAKLALMVGVAIAGILVMLVASYPDRASRTLAKLARKARRARAGD